MAEQFGKKVLREVDEDEFYKALPKLRKAVGTALSCVRCTSSTTAAAPPSSATPCARTILKRSCA